MLDRFNFPPFLPRRAEKHDPGAAILSAQPADGYGSARGGIAGELIRNSGLPGSALIEVGTDHRLADQGAAGEDVERVQGKMIVTLMSSLHTLATTF